MLDERALVDGCRNKDRTAQRKLYELFARKLFVVSQRYTKNRDDAEDVLQDSFVKAFQHIDTFRFECPLEAWLKRIVINTALKHIRKQKPWQNQAELEDVIPTALPQTEDSLSGLHYQQLLKMVQELPPGCQAVFNLYAIEGYTHPEIAELLDISEGTSKSQFSRARMLLQQKIQNERPIPK
ncbi:RNA polymerase sigma factor [Larkinella bovis]|uniref:RNA polymerase sigma factor n=1 Tax=Larkinella bovis TaxID=683041 RepID=A0ABW0III3_9BACT